MDTKGTADEDFGESEEEKRRKQWSSFYIYTQLLKVDRPEMKERSASEAYILAKAQKDRADI